MIIDLRDCLRLDDNRLFEGVEQPIPVWVCETQRFERMSPRRQRFTLQAVAELRDAFRALGSDLVIREGDRVECLTALAQQTGRGIRVGAASGFDERNQDRALNAERIDVSSLFRREQLPFEAVPEPFTKFRNKVQKKLKPDAPRAKPERFAPLPSDIEPGQMPSIPEVPREASAVMEFVGGEQAAHSHLAHYLSDPRRPSTYKETRNGLLGADYSTKFSPFLAQGSLSPRRIWQAVSEFEQQVIKNDSTYWIKFELLWREYFHWWVQDWGAELYRAPERYQTRQPWFEAWCDGETGVPFIDANMKELTQSGFMSNRGRQNVASFLAKDLGLDYRLGADFFEYHLLDYDHGSNWGNWAYVAGVGADPRDDRWFNVLLQATRYDKRGGYVRHWLPELVTVDDRHIHWPWTAGISPPPIVHPSGWNKVIMP